MTGHRTEISEREAKALRILDRCLTPFWDSASPPI
nr:MAG TPA: hypothetical protein [Siphoviridae sp. ctEy724]